MTPFERAWDHVVGGFRVADVIGSTAVQYAAQGDFKAAFAKMDEAEALARSVLDGWSAATSGSDVWESLDEPLREFAEAYAQTARAARADVASVLAGSTSDLGIAVTAILLRKTNDAARALTESARALSASLGGDPARIVSLTEE